MPEIWRFREGVQALDSVEDSLIESRAMLAGMPRDSFLKPELQELDRPDTIWNIETAAQRLKQALEQNQTIGICGDYDADGVCGTSLAVLSLEALGATVVWDIPDRFIDGYGINPRIVQSLSGKGAELIITIDNGIRAFEAANRCKELGIDLIVTDHHLPTDQLPDAYTIVNPNCKEDQSTLGDLCGTSVFLYILLHLRALLRNENNQKAQHLNVGDLLPLVAIATIADVVPLSKNNRILVREGLARIHATTKWYAELRSMNPHLPEHPDSETIGFQIAPRLNAAGRMGKAHAAVYFLLEQTESDSISFAQQAQKLDQMNRERKLVEAKIQTEAEQRSNNTATSTLVLADAKWNRGVVGIAAAKLMRARNAPVALGGINEGIATFSARSVEGFNIVEALEPIREDCTAFGGHASAAGFSAPVNALPKIQTTLESAFREQYPAGYVAIHYVDALLSEKPTHELWFSLQNLAPHGNRNPAPVFAIVDATVAKQYLLKNEHIKMTLVLNDGSYLDAIFWRSKEHYPLPQKIHALGTITRNIFRDKDAIEFTVDSVSFEQDPFLPSPPDKGNAS